MTRVQKSNLSFEMDALAGQLKRSTSDADVPYPHSQGVFILGRIMHIQIGRI